MIRVLRIFVSTVIFFLTLTIPNIVVQAIPSLPSSFYGVVKVNGGNVLEGTLIQVFIKDHLVAQCLSRNYQGDSVYSINVPGDNALSPELDGGAEGDAIQFEIDGVLLEPIGTWHSGTNVRIDLIGVFIPTPSLVRPILSPVPTITLINVVQDNPAGSPTSTISVLNNTTLTPTLPLRKDTITPLPMATRPNHSSTKSPQTVTLSPQSKEVWYSTPSLTFPPSLITSAETLRDSPTPDTPALTLDIPPNSVASFLPTKTNHDLVDLSSTMTGSMILFFTIFIAGIGASLWSLRKGK